MPRDIRSYFTSTATAKTSKNNPAPRTNKRRIISSDEDEVKTQSPVKRTKKTKKVEKHSLSPDSNDEKKSPLKIVSPADIFGKKPVRRQEAPKVSKSVRKQESKVHNDEDFEATLSQLDTSDIEKKYLEDEKSAKASIKEEKKSNTLKNENGNEKKKTSPVKVKVKRKNSSEDLEISELDSSTEKKKANTSISEPPEGSRGRNAALYKKYLERGGARDPGSKPIPVGAEHCLAGLSFLITGVLTSLEREEAEDLIKKYGGRILHQVSKKTDYIVVGEEPGPAKLQKAEMLHVKQISEDDLLELIRTRPAGSADNIKQPSVKAKGKQKSVESDGTAVSPSEKPKLNNIEIKKKPTSPIKNNAPSDVNKTSPAKTLSAVPINTFEGDSVKNIKKSPPKTTTQRFENEKVNERSQNFKQIAVNTETEALVEKYRPKTMKQILGQQTDKSNAKKLYKWLMNWHKNRTIKHTKPSGWGGTDDGASCKAALLSGPPGIGKTTTVQVVCKELGFDLVEFNASDTRSKKLLKEEVSKMLGNSTLRDYLTDGKIESNSKYVVLMDEVDGMAGNEDRGGLQELISLIKSSDMPIVCVCNDRSNPKMRTLAGYAFDLRFAKPKTEQIRGAMKSLCFKENIDISTEDLDRLIEATNHDIRQVINHLSLFVGKSAHQEKTERKHINKDLKLGPWDVLRKVFSAEEHKVMSIHDKSDLFFHDYSLAPLFVQENYLLVVPNVPRNELPERIAQCAESLALGDMVERSIRSNNAWSLLPTQACYSSVIPGSVMAGRIGGQIMFPAWFGRNSRTNKFDRLMQEITVHARLTTGVSKEAINLDYVAPLRNAIVRPLATDGSDGVEAAVNVMNQYHLLREDLDSLVELSLWPGQRDPMQFVDSKVKSAFTRTYNKDSVALPYSVTGTTAKKKTQVSQDEGFLDDDQDDEGSDSNDDNVESDKMIKAKKPSTSKKAESKAETKSSDAKKGQKGQKASKPAGRGRGRAKAK